MLHIYDDCSNCDMVAVKNISMDQYVEKWEAERVQKVKLRTYNMYKWGYSVKREREMHLFQP